MRLTEILPSIRFTTIVGSIALAALLVWGAYTLTHPAAAPASSLAADSSLQTTDADWKAQLDAIQAQNPNNKAPQAPDSGTVSTLLSAATSDNLTDTVARTLLVNLSAAKAQGLGDDIPTQDQLISQAASQISARAQKVVYVNADLSLSANSKDAQTAYGNAFMKAVSIHPTASYAQAIYALGTSTDNGDPKRLTSLSSIGAEYAGLARDLSDVAVPPTLAPIHLKIVNNFERMAEMFPDMGKIYSDPLRGLAAFQLYDALNQETLRLFINIAQEFSQNGILFSKDDPGAAWSTLVP